MPINPFSGDRDTRTAPATNASTITPHDTNELAVVTKGLYVGGAGDIVCRFSGDSDDTTLVGLLAGVVYPFSLSHVRATGTDATNLVGIY